MRWKEIFCSETELPRPWHPWFAWRPVKTISREWVWLEWVERGDYFDHDVRYNAPNTFFGAWVFRFPKGVA